MSLPRTRRLGRRYSVVLWLRLYFAIARAGSPPTGTARHAAKSLSDQQQPATATMTPVAVKCPIRRSAPGEFGAGSALDEQRNEVPDPAVFKLGVGALDDGVDALGWNVCVAVGEPTLDFFNHDVLIDLRHVDSMPGRPGAVNRGIDVRSPHIVAIEPVRFGKCEDLLDEQRRVRPGAGLPTVVSVAREHHSYDEGDREVRAATPLGVARRTARATTTP